MSLNDKLKLNATAIIVVAILAVGIFARVYGLADHFGHVDDLGVAKRIFDYTVQGKSALFATSLEWTYAPFQFLFTSQLIHLEQSYRQILFWGRLPSCIAGIIALFCLISFYRSYDAVNKVKLLMALLLISFSWENIIFAKQMHNYAIGVMAVIILLWRYIRQVKNENVSLLDMVISSGLLAVLTSMQYSVMFFVPAFFVGLFINGILLKHSVLMVLRNCLVGGITYLALIAPMWIYFVSRHVSLAGQHMSLWNRGPNGEFYFQIPAGEFTEQLRYIAVFFIKNSFIVFQNNLSFAPLSTVLSQGLTWVFLIFFIGGIIAFVVSRERHVKLLGVFGVVLAVTWVGLVIINQLTLSPTRHSLILLPILAIMVAEGLYFISSKIFKNEQLKFWSQLVFVVLLIGIFCYFYPQFLRERQDHFNEEKIVTKLEENKVTMLFSAEFTVQLELMKSLRDYFDFYDVSFLSHKLIYKKTPQPYDRIAWISRIQKLTPDVFERARFIYNNPKRRGPSGEPALPYSAAEYRVIYKEEIDSNVFVENGNWVNDVPNSYYFYILERTKK